MPMPTDPTIGHWHHLHRPVMIQVLTLRQLEQGQQRYLRQFHFKEYLGVFQQKTFTTIWPGKGSDTARVVHEYSDQELLGKDDKQEN